MVWVRVAFHENDGNHENDENDEDNSDSYKQGVECWICGNHGNHENDENHENPGCKPRVPQTTGLEIPEHLPLSSFMTRCLCPSFLSVASLATAARGHLRVFGQSPFPFHRRAKLLFTACEEGARGLCKGLPQVPDPWVFSSI